jgi:hypothetical protein
MTAETDRTRRSFVLEEAVAILARTPASLDALLRGLPDAWIVAHEGGEVFIAGAITSFLNPQSGGQDRMAHTKVVAR